MEDEGSIRSEINHLILISDINPLIMLETEASVELV